MTVVPLNTTAADWYQDHENLAALLRYLERRGEAPTDVPYLLEKPWKWTSEFLAMERERGDAA